MTQLCKFPITLTPMMYSSKLLGKKCYEKLWTLYRVLLNIEICHYFRFAYWIICQCGPNKLEWKTLARRRVEHRATFIYKYLINLFSHRFNIELNKDISMIIIWDVKTISVSSRNWGYWTLTNFASNDWNKLDLSIRQSPSLVSLKER